MPEQYQPLAAAHRSPSWMFDSYPSLPLESGDYIGMTETDDVSSLDGTMVGSQYYYSQTALHSTHIAPQENTYPYIYSYECTSEHYPPANDQVSALSLMTMPGELSDGPGTSLSEVLGEGSGARSSSLAAAIAAAANNSAASWKGAMSEPAKGFQHIHQQQLSFFQTPSQMQQGGSSLESSSKTFNQLVTSCTSAKGKAQTSMETLQWPDPQVTQPEHSASALKSTHVLSHLISCFVVGGEIRLCSPQIYSVIMHDVHEEDLAHWIREFGIVDQFASSEQLEALRLNRAIPGDSAQCGLMTKTNAERLIGAVIDSANYRTLPPEKQRELESIMVQHECFGGCEGRLYTALAPGPCVECTHCNCLMTPESFCRHSHATGRAFRKFCFWGFDSQNWRNYLRVHTDFEEDVAVRQKFKEFLNPTKATPPAAVAAAVAAVSKAAPNQTPAVDLAKTSMFSSNVSAIAAHLLAQHQQQQVAASALASATSHSIAGPQGDAAGSMATTSAFQPTAALTSSGAAASSFSSSLPASLPSNPNSLLQMIQMNALANSHNHAAAPTTATQPPQQSPFNLAQLQAILQQQQQQQHNQPSPFASLFNVLQHYQNQHQLSAALNNARVAMAEASSSKDGCDVPRKRAHTISDPSVMRSKENVNAAPARFGQLPADQNIIVMLSRCTTPENVHKISELMDSAISERVSPLVEEMNRLRKELADLRLSGAHRPSTRVSLGLASSKLDGGNVPQPMEEDPQEEDVDVEDVSLTATSATCDN